ncbi:MULTISPECIES: endonuclease/exonuclease/phosphatase family protein [unclassified Ruegeria]|uniref:endonuclease/exonuclease/phosphatase family protein n=1 Tax=unclassified Ruegeria TaxID=2625375 RepID=UPI0014897638|nr:MULTISPECIES: endonuclease/exonuclease/phosphatase family protein [unclassified Ruegeria]NOD65519.1 endonuclease/exonuclease/phosphatase family protein [Ruegeria sp. HKCCD6109]
MIRALVLFLLPFSAQAEVVRIATYNTELSRKGPALLLRDIGRDDPQVLAVVSVISAAQPDIIALQGIDWDLEGAAIQALSQKLRNAGVDYGYFYAAQPNAGLETALDLDGDGRTHGPGDAQGWGQFTGQGGLAILSRYEIITDEILSFSELLWQDLPGAVLPFVDDHPFPSEAAHKTQRLSSTAHWVVPIDTPLGRLGLMTFHAAPPVFDGPEDRNGLRNRDEIRFWSVLLNGDLGPVPKDPFVIAGDANLDPSRGEGHKQAIHALLENPVVQDPLPTDPTGSIATVDWKATGEMRVDFVLPSRDLRVLDSGVLWPKEDAPLREDADQASRHRLVWVDVTLP